MRHIRVTITIFAVAAGKLAALSIAKPMPIVKAGGIAIPLTRHPSCCFLNDKRFSDLDVVSSHGISIEEKIRSSLDNYEINTGMVHPFAIKRNESGIRTRGVSVPLSAFQDVMWNLEISIGTPAKTLKVEFDTGSADMWVIQTGCSGIPGDRDLWSPLFSDSAEYQGKPFQLKYADGSIVNGAQFTDNVTIAGITADPQTFGSVTSYISHLLENGNADGLLGLAFPSISQLGVDPLLESLVKQNKISNPTFSMKLSPSGVGELYIGGANSLLYSGEIVYTRVTNPGFWQVSMDDVRVNGKPILVNVPAIIDTGANHIYGDWNRVSELYQYIGARLDKYNGYDFYYLPCDSFPTISFTFGGKVFEIPPEALKIPPDPEGSTPNCLSVIVGRRAPYLFWSIGFPFLQSVYSVFDYGGSQVGFAELA